MLHAVPQERLKAMEHIRTADPHAFHEKVRPGDPDVGAAATTADSATGAAAAAKAAAKAVAAAKASSPLPAAAASQHHVRGMNQERAKQGDRAFLSYAALAPSSECASIESFWLK